MQNSAFKCSLLINSPTLKHIDDYDRKLLILFKEVARWLLDTMRFEKYKVTEVFRAFVNSSVKIMIKYNKLGVFRDGILDYL